VFFSPVIHKIFSKSFIRDVKCLFDSNLRSSRHEERRLKNLPRFLKTNTKINGKLVEFVDITSFLHLREEIFEKEIYKFPSKIKNPRIIDCGANIGLSTLYFYEQYPNARITAFEADPQIFQTLDKNISQLNSNDIEIINKAVWFEKTTLKFNQNGSDGGNIGMESNSNNCILVDSVSLSDYLDEPIDFLKIDIEGAEHQVIPSCKNKLKNVKFLFIEYHSCKNDIQCLDTYLKLLRENNFRYDLHTWNFNKNPFFKKVDTSKFDLLVNIFAWNDNL
tara:strand:+ start:222 stop:1052 length:831 start_codon:yes stop_codon:yes gene_type:complete